MSNNNSWTNNYVSVGKTLTISGFGFLRNEREGRSSRKELPDRGRRHHGARKV